MIIIKSMNNSIQQILPNDVKTRITYTGRKLGTKFQIKDLTKNQHEHDLIYYRIYYLIYSGPITYVRSKIVIRII